MKVLAGSRIELHPAGAAARLCAGLAGEDGAVVSLAFLGVKNPYRRFSAAEVEAVRGALRDETGVVGYFCRGVASVTGAQETPAGARVVVVADHVNLTWRSPLSGPNDEHSGPRFPSIDGVYAPEAAFPLGTREDGMIVVRGVVAGVVDDRALSEYERELVTRFGWVAVSSELVAPVILAAHMGLRVAAVVMV
jgi:hypothetical protein